MTSRTDPRSDGAISPNWILFATIVASGMVFLDGTVVNVAIRRIGEELPGTLLGTLEAQTYITSGYLAVLAAFLVLAGALADKYGRRLIFLTGLAGFGMMSVLCGIAPNLEFLVVARLLQGLTGALLVPGSLSIITAAFDGAARARAFGIWAAATSALIVLGPLVGGVLVDTISWRMAFLINVPFAIVAAYATWRYVPETRDPDAPQRLDWLGSIVIAVAVGGIAFGLVRGYETGWSETSALVVLGVGIVAAVLFPVLMVIRRDPLIPPRLFRHRAFTVINLSTFLIYGGLYVWQFLLYLFIQGTLGYTALGAATMVALPMGIFLAAGSTRVGTLAGRIGVWPFLVIGPIIMALSQLWLVRMPPDSAAWLADAGDPGTWIPPAGALIDVLPSVILFGVGIMLVVAPLTTGLMSSIPVSNAGLGSAINNAVSRVGQPLVLAVLFIVISSTFYDTLDGLAPGTTSITGAEAAYQPLNPPPDGATEAQASATAVASTDAFRLAMMATAALLLLGALVNAAGLERRPSPGPEEIEEDIGTARPETAGADDAGAEPASSEPASS